MTNDHCGTVSVVAVPSPASWHREADIVVIGSGAAGMPAAILAREAGVSVILVEAEPDIGGHAIISGGNVPLGGGTSAQKAAGIEDFAGPRIPGQHRLVRRAAQRVSGLPL